VHTSENRLKKAAILGHGRLGEEHDGLFWACSSGLERKSASASPSHRPLVYTIALKMEIPAKEFPYVS
jgi:hypothetical protein